MANSIFETIEINGKELLKEVRRLIQEGNVRRLTIKNKKGKVLLEMPLTVGAAGVGGMILLAPFLSAISFIALMVGEATILVERTDGRDEKEVEAEDIEIVEE